MLAGSVNCEQMCIYVCNDISQRTTVGYISRITNSKCLSLVSEPFVFRLL
jgi:hypothetical protein